MNPRILRRAAGAALFAATSCSVYDTSLLGDGGAAGFSSGATSGASGGSGKSGGNGGQPGAGSSGVAGTESDDGGAGSGGLAGMGGGIGLGGASGEAGEGGGGTTGNGGNGGNGGTLAVAGKGGSGGTAGGGGSAGSAVGGSAGSGGTAAGSGGTAGTVGGTAGTGGAATATGCAKLSVPIDDASDTAHFVITLGSAADLSAATATVSMRYYVQAAIGGSIYLYVQDPSNAFFGEKQSTWPALAGQSGWSTITWGVGADTGTTSVTRANIKRIGIEMNAYSSTTWSNPTVVYVDSITVTTAATTVLFTFDTTGSVSTTPSGADVGGQVLWLNNSGSDTKATGAGLSLGWQATCP